MTAFHKIIAVVRSALDSRPAAAEHPAADHAEVVPVASGARHAELAAEFARELGLLKAHFMGILAPDELKRRTVALAAELGLRSTVVGKGVTTDWGPIIRALKQSGASVINPEDAAVGSSAIRNRIAQCDLGIIEADYAIAATGTFAVIAGPTRPNSITLLPAVNLIAVHIDRLMPDLAAVMALIGAENVSAHRVALITGPSRTADIEKLIVLGVHGPRQLYAAVLRSRYA